MAEILSIVESSTPPFSWWTALIASCSTRFAAADPGSQEMGRWGESLLLALRSARRRGGLPWEETLHREVIAKLAMTSERVESPEIPDGANGIWREFVRDLIDEGENLEDLQPEIASIRSMGTESISPVRIQQLMRIRFVLREFLRNRERLTSDVEEELNRWSVYLAVE
ncbi:MULTISPECIES: hypothetical protein [unclassified Streptomyces]|uniref:hypothetical protein n=1 Tax=unclassified Streptomyces TaxID=2593676 RepID=UPI002E32789A|nr:hypothetical protein [Streptomyces sp. NBC_01278]